MPRIVLFPETVNLAYSHMVGCQFVGSFGVFAIMTIMSFRVPKKLLIVQASSYPSVYSGYIVPLSTWNVGYMWVLL